MRKPLFLFLVVAFGTAVFQPFGADQDPVATSQKSSKSANFEWMGNGLKADPTSGLPAKRAHSVSESRSEPAREFTQVDEIPKLLGPLAIRESDLLETEIGDFHQVATLPPLATIAFLEPPILKSVFEWVPSVAEWVRIGDP